MIGTSSLHKLSRVSDWVAEPETGGEVGLLHCKRSQTKVSDSGRKQL